MGSGKTACMVREIIKNIDDKINYTNIKIFNKKARYVLINRDMIIKKELLSTTKKGEPNYKYMLNEEFWKNLRKEKKYINVILDEAHTLVDSRRAMSKENKIMMDFIALLRRILGDSDSDYGELILITQLGRRLDVIARDLVNNVHYHICHYKKRCNKCKFAIYENNEQLEKMKICPVCNNNKFIKSNFIIEKFEFENVEKCSIWIDTGIKNYFKHYYITDIEKYFKFYDTFQWENLISEY